MKMAELKERFTKMSKITGRTNNKQGNEEEQEPIIGEISRKSSDKESNLTPTSPKKFRKPDDPDTIPEEVISITSDKDERRNSLPTDKYIGSKSPGGFSEVDSLLPTVPVSRKNRKTVIGPTKHRTQPVLSGGPQHQISVSSNDSASTMITTCSSKSKFTTTPGSNLVTSSSNQNGNNSGVENPVISANLSIDSADQSEHSQPFFNLPDDPATALDSTTEDLEKDVGLFLDNSMPQQSHDYLSAFGPNTTANSSGMSSRRVTCTLTPASATNNQQDDNLSMMDRTMSQVNYPRPLIRSNSDTEINYSVLEEYEEVPGSVNYIAETGNWNYRVVLRALHSTVLQTTHCSTRVCELALQCLMGLFELGLFEKRKSKKKNKKKKHHRHGHHHSHRSHSRGSKALFTVRKEHPSLNKLKRKLRGSSSNGRSPIPPQIYTPSRDRIGSGSASSTNLGRRDRRVSMLVTNNSAVNNPVSATISTPLSLAHNSQISGSNSVLTGVTRLGDSDEDLLSHRNHITNNHANSSPQKSTRRSGGNHNKFLSQPSSSNFRQKFGDKRHQKRASSKTTTQIIDHQQNQNYGLSNNEIAIEIIIKIIKILGCSHEQACRGGPIRDKRTPTQPIYNRDIHSSYLSGNFVYDGSALYSPLSSAREQTQQCLKNLYEANPNRFRAYLTSLARVQSLQDIVDFLHSFTGFCNEQPLFMKSTGASANSYGNRFNQKENEEKRFAEVVLIAGILEPFVERLIVSKKELTSQENLSLYSEIRQLFVYLREVHGSTFRQVLLVGLSGKVWSLQQYTTYQYPPNTATLPSATKPTNQYSSRRGRSSEIIHHPHHASIPLASSTMNSSRCSFAANSVAGSLIAGDQSANTSRRHRPHLFRRVTEQQSLLSTSGINHHPHPHHHHSNIYKRHHHSHHQPYNPQKKRESIMIPHDHMDDHNDSRNNDATQEDNDHEDGEDGEVEEEGSDGDMIIESVTVPAQSSVSSSLSSSQKTRSNRAHSLVPNYSTQFENSNNNEQSEGDSPNTFSKRPGISRARSTGRSIGTGSSAGLPNASNQNQAPNMTANQIPAPIPIVREKRPIDCAALKRGMSVFSFLMDSFEPGSIPEPQLVAAILDLEAPVLSRACVLLELSNFVTRCNRGEWPGWMRFNMMPGGPGGGGPAAGGVYYRHYSSVAMSSMKQTAGGNNRRSGMMSGVEIQRRAGQLFHAWAEAIGTRIQHFMEIEQRADRFSSVADIQDESQARELQKLDEEEDFLDDATVNNREGDACPYALKAVAIQLMLSITTYLRETHQYLPPPAQTATTTQVSSQTSQTPLSQPSGAGTGTTSTTTASQLTRQHSMYYQHHPSNAHQIHRSMSPHHYGNHLGDGADDDGVVVVGDEGDRESMESVVGAITPTAIIQEQPTGTVAGSRRISFAFLPERSGSLHSSNNSLEQNDMTNAAKEKKESIISRSQYYNKRYLQQHHTYLDVPQLQNATTVSDFTILSCSNNNQNSCTSNNDLQTPLNTTIFPPSVALAASSFLTPIRKISESLERRRSIAGKNLLRKRRGSGNFQRTNTVTRIGKDTNSSIRSTRLGSIRYSRKESSQSQISGTVEGPVSALSVDEVVSTPQTPMQQQPDVQPSVTMGTSANLVKEQDNCANYMPWLSVVIQFANKTNFVCSHSGFCHPDCYERQQRQCRRLLEAVRSVYGVDLSKSNKRTSQSKQKANDGAGNNDYDNIRGGPGMRVSVISAGQSLDSENKSISSQLDGLEDSESSGSTLNNNTTLKPGSSESQTTDECSSHLSSSSSIMKSSSYEGRSSIPNTSGAGVSMDIEAGMQLLIHRAELGAGNNSGMNYGDDKKMSLWSRGTRRKESSCTAGFHSPHHRRKESGGGSGVLDRLLNKSRGNNSSLAEGLLHNDEYYDGGLDGAGGIELGEHLEGDEGGKNGTGRRNNIKRRIGKPVDHPILRYLDNYVHGLSHSCFSTVNKGALLLTPRALSDILPVAWELLLEPDNELVSSAATIILLASIRIPTLVQSLLSRELATRHTYPDSKHPVNKQIKQQQQQEDTGQRIAALLRFRKLWTSRFQFWQRLEDGAAAHLRVPPPYIEFVLPSPTLGHPGCDVPDPSWTIRKGQSVEEVQLRQNEAAKTFVTASTTRRKQQQEMLERAVTAEEQRRKIARQEFHLTTSSVLERASYEIAFNKEHKEDMGLEDGTQQSGGAIQEEFNAAVRRLSVAPINRNLNMQARNLSWRHGSFALTRTATLVCHDDEESGGSCCIGAGGVLSGISAGALASQGVSTMPSTPVTLSNQPLQHAQCVFPSALCAAAIQIIHLLDDNDVNCDGIAVSTVAEHVVWQALVEDPALFLRYLLERLTRRDTSERQVLLHILRVCLQRLPELPTQSAHALFNSLVGYAMFYVRTPSLAAPDALAGALSLLWLVVRFVQNVYFKDLKQILRKEQIDPTLMITANLPCAKQFNVFDEDVCVPQLVRLQDENKDYRFVDILKEALQDSNIPEKEHYLYYLCDDRSSIIRNSTHYVRDFYFFKRNQTPKLRLKKMSVDEGTQMLQQNAFNLKLLEIGKVMFSVSILKHTPPNQNNNHVYFLHEELTRLASFPRKALDSEFSLYQAPQLGRQLLGLDMLHKVAWCNFIGLLFERMPHNFPWTNDIHLFLNIYNGVLILHAEDTAMLRYCLAGYLQACQHFKMVFSVSGYLGVMPTILRVYSRNRHNPVLTQAIQFICRQFYILHRTPFVLQMFGSISNYIDFQGNDADFYKIKPIILYEILMAIGQDIEDRLDILQLLSCSKPLRALDFCYENESDSWSVLEAVTLCVTVIVYAPESTRARQMTVILQALLPLILTDLSAASGHCQQSHNHNQHHHHGSGGPFSLQQSQSVGLLSGSGQSGGGIPHSAPPPGLLGTPGPAGIGISSDTPLPHRAETQAIQQLAVSVKQLICTCDYLTRTYDRSFGGTSGVKEGREGKSSDEKCSFRLAGGGGTNFSQAQNSVIMDEMDESPYRLLDDQPTQQQLPQQANTNQTGGLMGRFRKNTLASGSNMMTDDEKPSQNNPPGANTAANASAGGRGTSLVMLAPHEAILQIACDFYTACYKRLTELGERHKAVVELLDQKSIMRLSELAQVIAKQIPVDITVLRSKALQRFFLEIPPFIDWNHESMKSCKALENLIYRLHRTMIKILKDNLGRRHIDWESLTNLVRAVFLIIKRNRSVAYMKDVREIMYYLKRLILLENSEANHQPVHAMNDSLSSVQFSSRHDPVPGIVPNSPNHIPLQTFAQSDNLPTDMNPNVTNIGGASTGPSIPNPNIPAGAPPISNQQQDIGMLYTSNSGSIPAKFSDMAIKFFALMLQCLEGSYKLKDFCERYDQRYGNTESILVNFLANIIIPLLIRCGAGRNDGLKLSDENIYFIFDLVLSSLNPLLHSSASSAIPSSSSMNPQYGHSHSHHTHHHYYGHHHHHAHHQQQTLNHTQPFSVVVVGSPTGNTNNPPGNTTGSNVSHNQVPTANIGSPGTAISGQTTTLSPNMAYTQQSSTQQHSLGITTGNGYHGGLASLVGLTAHKSFTSAATTGTTSGSGHTASLRHHHHSSGVAGNIPSGGGICPGDTSQFRSSSISHSEKSFKITNTGNDYLYKLAFLALKIITICYPRHTLVESRAIAYVICELGLRKRGGIQLWKFLDFLITRRPAPLFITLLPFLKYKAPQIKCESQAEQALQQILIQKFNGLHIPLPRSDAVILKELMMDLRVIKDEIISGLVQQHQIQIINPCTMGTAGLHLSTAVPSSTTAAVKQVLPSFTTTESLHQLSNPAAGAQNIGQDGEEKHRGDNVGDEGTGENDSITATESYMSYEPANMSTMPMGRTSTENINDLPPPILAQQQRKTAGSFKSTPGNKKSGQGSTTSSTTTNIVRNAIARNSSRRVKSREGGLVLHRHWQIGVTNGNGAGGTGAANQKQGRSGLAGVSLESLPNSVGSGIVGGIPGGQFDDPNARKYSVRLLRSENNRSRKSVKLRPPSKYHQHHHHHQSGMSTPVGSAMAAAQAAQLYGSAAPYLRESLTRSRPEELIEMRPPIGIGGGNEDPNNVNTSVSGGFGSIPEGGDYNIGHDASSCGSSTNRLSILRSRSQDTEESILSGGGGARHRSGTSTSHPVTMSSQPSSVVVVVGGDGSGGNRGVSDEVLLATGGTGAALAESESSNTSVISSEYTSLLKTRPHHYHHK